MSDSAPPAESSRPDCPAAPRLSLRLGALADHVPPGARLADIGTDHAYLPVALVLAGRLSSAVAIDIRAGAIAQARRTVARYAVADRVELRLGDGLTPLRPGEADVVVISGLGGPTIVRILSADSPALDHVRRLILAPQSAAWRVRQWLMRSGWVIGTERHVREGPRTYEIVVAERGDPPAGDDRPVLPAADRDRHVP